MLVFSSFIHNILLVFLSKDTKASLSWKPVKHLILAHEPSHTVFKHSKVCCFLDFLPFLLHIRSLKLTIIINNDNLHLHSPDLCMDIIIQLHFTVLLKENYVKSTYSQYTTYKPISNYTK